MKTAYELAMEKLRKKDEETGESRTTLDEDQKREIAGDPQGPLGAAGRKGDTVPGRPAQGQGDPGP